MSVRAEKNGPVTTVILSRPERRNAVDRASAAALAEAFRSFEKDEEARVAVRNVRRDANEHIKKLQKDGTITEDDRDGALKDVQKSTDDYIGQVDEKVESKEKEIMEV